MKPCDQQIEAAAIAIRQEFADRLGRARDWHDLPERLKDEYRAEAKAALRAAGTLLE